MSFQTDFSFNSKEENKDNLSITDENIYLSRRKIIAGFASLQAIGLLDSHQANAETSQSSIDRLNTKVDPLTPESKITSYNNFYEFGLDKEDPQHLAQSLQTDPWTVEFSGECEHPFKISVSDLIRTNQIQERVYRHRCVEGWSMVIPWTGVQLSDLIQKASPNKSARFVSFQTLYDPKQMPGQMGNDLAWPYREGLRMDEAMHGLTILATGLYGKLLPKQDGAPIRLVVPWKYGFKSIKSVVKISFQKNQPSTSWNQQASSEYGFYANVNPMVDHPRWSQARERRIGDFLKRPTLLFNGYGDQVASLYQGMDLTKDF